MAFLIINILHQSSTCVTIDETMWTHLQYSNSIVYIMVYSWGYPVSGFGQIYNAIYPLLKYYREELHCHKKKERKKSVLCLFIPPCPNALQPVIPFTVSILLSFPECFHFLHLFPLLDSSFIFGDE